MIFYFDDFELDPTQLELRRQGAPIKCDALVLRMLCVLAEHAGQLVPKRDLMAKVWGGRSVTDNAVTVTITRLRTLLGHRRGEHEVVVNVHNRGYRFVREVGVRAAEPKPSLLQPSPVLAGPPFVGRERLMRRLRAALDEARDGRGSACMLIGEPGIGKTRALETLAREASDAGLPVAWGYCREIGDTPPLWPFAQLVRELIAKLPLAARDPRFARAVPELRRLLPELADAMSLQVDCHDHPPAQMAKHRIFDAITRVFAIAAEHAPCVLILDDLHRADPASLELLRYFVDELAGTHIAVYATLRKPDNTREHLNYVLGHRNVARIALEHLSESDVASYVHTLLREATPALAHAVFVKSEGNPFFMTELLRQARDNEGLELQVPDAALDLVRQRVSVLDDAARGALSCAAVIGRRFSLPVLQAVTGAELSLLMVNLDDALAGDVVVTDASSNTAFAFSHELLRGVLYDAMPAAMRRTCHLRVAEALEQRVLAGDSIPAADLAYHFRSGLPAGDPRKTVQYCRAAAADAARVYAFADATRYLGHARQALDLVDDASPRLRSGLLLYQAVLARAHSSREAEPLIREVIEIARAQKAGVRLAHAALLLDPYRGFPSLAGSRAVLQEALQLLAAHDIGPRAALLARLASIAPLAYDAAASGEQLAAAQALARDSGSLLALYNVRVAELYLSGGPSRRVEASQLLREVERLSRDPALAMTIQTVLLELHRAIAAAQDGNLRRMGLALERAEAHCRHIDSDLLWHIERFRAIARINAGQRAEGLQQLQALHRSARQSPTSASEFLCAYDECVVVGEPSSVPKHSLRDALAYDAGDPPNVWAAKVRALTAAGFQDEALALLELVPPANLAALPEDRDYLGTLGALARAVITLQRRDYADALEPLLAPYAERFALNVSFYCEGSVSQILGGLAQLRGDHAAAIALFETGSFASQGAGLLLCAAQARQELAQPKRQARRF